MFVCNQLQGKILNLFQKTKFNSFNSTKLLESFKLPISLNKS